MALDPSWLRPQQEGGKIIFIRHLGFLVIMSSTQIINLDCKGAAAAASIVVW